MKVLLFHPWIKSKGGAEKLILEYASRSSHRVDIITWFYNPNKTFKEFSKLNVISVFPEYVDSISRSFLFRGPFFGFIGNLIKVLKDDLLDDYDVLLISTAGIAETILSRLNVDIPIVLYVHTPLRAAYKWDILFNFRNRFRHLPLSKLYYKIGIHIYNKWEKSVWSKVDLAIFNSLLSLQRALDKNLIHKEKATVITPGVDLEVSPGEYENYFLYVGRFGMAKRQDVVLLAWKMFTRHFKDYQLILAGGLENKRYFRYLQKLTKSLNLKNVSFIVNAPWPKILQLHSNALAEIQVPFMEDFGIAALEAVAAEKPLIAADSMGVVYHYLKYLKSVILVREHIDKIILAKRVYNAMVSFIKNRDYYIEESKKSRKLLLTKYDLSWESFTKKLDDTLARLVQNF